MKPWLISILALGVLSSCGCSSASSHPSASPPTSAQADCERTGGVWQAALSYCKYPAPEKPRY